MAATAPIQPLAREPPYATGVDLKRQKTKKKKKKKKKRTATKLRGFGLGWGEKSQLFSKRAKTQVLEDRPCRP